MTSRITLEGGIKRHAALRVGAAAGASTLLSAFSAPPLECAGGRHGSQAGPADD